MNIRLSHPMSLNAFLAELAEMTQSGHRTWELDHGAIRSVEDELCPLHEAWLYQNECEEMAEDWSEAGYFLRLRSSTAERIMHAADGRGDKKLRARLLVACGLEQPN